MLATIVWPLVGAGALLIVVGAALLLVSRPRSSGAAPSVSRTIVVPQLTGPVMRHERTIAWTQRIDPDAGPFDVDERRRIIEALAVVGEPWCAEILAAAYGEEVEALKESVIDAIGRCRGEIVPTLVRALSSHRVVERYAAVDAASKRGAIEVLERGIRDVDGTVALAAAYGFARAGRRDLIDMALAGRDDLRANEIRRVLPVLALLAIVIFAGIPGVAPAQSTLPAPAPVASATPGPEPSGARVRLDRPGSDAEAAHLYGNTGAKRYVLEGNVVVHSDPKVDPDAAMTESDQPLTLKADRIDVDRTTLKYDAIGHVDFVQGDRFGSADTATLDDRTHELDLIGHAKMGEGERRVTADRVEYNLQSHHFRVAGHVEYVSPVPQHSPNAKGSPAPKKRKRPFGL